MPPGTRDTASEAGRVQLQVGSGTHTVQAPGTSSAALLCWHLHKRPLNNQRWSSMLAGVWPQPDTLRNSHYRDPVTFPPMSLPGTTCYEGTRPRCAIATSHAGTEGVHSELSGQEWT